MENRIDYIRRSLTFSPGTGCVRTFSAETVEYLLYALDAAIAERDTAREGLRIATKMNDEAEADRALGARLRSVLLETGHDADSLESAEGEPSRASLADFVLRLAVALREEGGR